MKFFTLSLTMIILLFPFIAAADQPIKSLTEDKGSASQCQSFIKNEVRKLNAKGFKCRTVMGIVFVCDNDVYHAEWGCEGSEAWMEVFDQNDRNWKRFYID